MDDYHAKNPQFKDKRSFFFFTTFLFISAMLGLVFSNNLIWLYFFWEITTLCSFLLIGYNQTEEARHNAFKALEFNLLGGLSLVIAITYLYFTKTTIELDRLMVMDKVAVMLPVALISFAGIIKSAQFPFSGWLVGAMVAPTPVSALLHSSTMVEAGVYLILRFALILDKTMVGYAVALIGGLSFLLASLIALTQSNSKKVLAYSTVANLGLVLLCAGIGTFEAVWAAVLLIIFHALIKGLLFLCVGVFEDKLQSRDIEDMSGLIITMPKLSVVFQIGMAGMFLAPFGMLISKWAVIKAIVDYNPALSVFVVFGSAATILLWVKWLGRLIIVIEPAPRAKEKICNGTWLPLYLLSGITVVLIALFPYISEILIDPYIMEIYKKTIEMGHDNIVIMSIMLALLILFPISFIKHEKRVKVTSAYLGGANIKEGTGFYGAMGETKQLEMRNYYFDKYFNEQGLLKVGRKVSLVLIFIMFAAALL
jgi:ech hydrogenase subunit A